jgi:V8-like Glu-specific endopeptidase
MANSAEVPRSGENDTSTLRVAPESTTMRACVVTEEGLVLRSKVKHILAIAAIAALAATGGAFAVVGGEADTTHTYVGAALQHQVQNGVSGNEHCSGFLISETKFVTAAHCFQQNGDLIRITFAQNSRDPGAQFIEVPASSLVNSHDFDIAIITLPSQTGVGVATPGTADPKDLLDVVGYGWETLSHKMFTSFGSRQIATTKTAIAGSLSDVYLKLLADPGVCLGDSGGPALIHGTNTVVAVNVGSNGNPNCNGISYSLRLDNPGVQQFIAANR